MTNPPCRLYLITPPVIADSAAFADSLRAALAGGDVAALQVRLKGVADTVLKDVLDAIRPIAQAHGVAVILNDRPDLAAKFDCDGVHVGQDDASYAEARKLVGPRRIIGVTCHDSRHLAMEAAEAGADYVAFGAFFDTATKDPKTRADIEVLRVWQETMQTPCVAIGGITVETAAELAAAGADFLAVSAGVWAYPEGPQAAVAAFNREIAKGVALRETP
ncbi:MAG: thiamine phosphate synthase [Caulobacteraceae bacterium]